MFDPFWWLGPCTYAVGWGMHSSVMINDGSTQSCSPCPMIVKDREESGWTKSMVKSGWCDRTVCLGILWQLIYPFLVIETLLAPFLYSSGYNTNKFHCHLSYWGSGSNLRSWFMQGVEPRPQWRFSPAICLNLNPNIGSRCVCKPGLRCSWTGLWPVYSWQYGAPNGQLYTKSVVWNKKCWAGTYSAQWNVTQMLDLLLVQFEVTTKVEVGGRRTKSYWCILHVLYT